MLGLAPTMRSVASTVDPRPALKPRSTSLYESSSLMDGLASRSASSVLLA